MSAEYRKRKTVGGSRRTRHGSVGVNGDQRVYTGNDNQSVIRHESIVVRGIRASCQFFSPETSKGRNASARIKEDVT